MQQPQMWIANSMDLDHLINKTNVGVYSTYQKQT